MGRAVESEVGLADTGLEPTSATSVTRSAVGSTRKVWLPRRRSVGMWIRWRQIDQLVAVHVSEPTGAPDEADLIILDPPYWQQATGRYSDDERDLGNQPLAVFRAT